MADFLFPLLLLAALFVGFGLVHGNGKGGFGCSDCTGGCAEPSQCKRERDEATTGE